VAQKIKQLPNHQKIVLNRIKAFIIILFVGIRYSMRDLLSDLNNYTDPQTSDTRQIR